MSHFRASPTLRMEPMLDGYNDNSLLQASCQTVGNPMLARMAALYAEQRDTKRASCARLVDYGCSGGRNSTAPVQTLTQTLRSSLPALSVECVLQDLPSNTWNRVMLQEAPKLTTAFDANVHVLCVGNSFYNQICADESVDLAYSYVAAHFLSDSPPLPSHVLMHEADENERGAWRVQAANDWERFLLHRARELKRGGKMMISTMSRDSSGYSWQQVSHLVWENIQAACSRGSLTTREAEALCIPACLRSEAEILAPFNASSPVAGLLEPQLLEFARTQVHGERTLPHAVLAARVRRRIESVWGGMFVTQLMRLGRDDATARAVLQDVWDGVEEILVHDTSRAAAGARVMPRRSPTTPARTGAVIRSRYPMGPRILDDTLAQRGASDGHRGRADDDHEGRVRPAATLFSASLPAIVPPAGATDRLGYAD